MMLTKAGLFYLLMSIGTALCKENTAELRSVFLLARHGERYPCHHLPHRNYPKEFLERTCQLTKHGAKQHFELGQFIRNRFDTLLSSEDFNQVIYRPSNIHNK